ncbi:DMT family transporter [Enterovibrio norvegicus]|uniref:DMT family transporter n=1 Tax=Enterovibrio norvegicus TaxID=188144 RepID=UPI001F52AFE8|nr:DMT family transporter [Enterovibrio norvegicus]
MMLLKLPKTRDQPFHTERRRHAHQHGLTYIVYYCVNQMGAIVASGVTYIPPVVALLIGAFLINEPISSVDLGAMAFIMVGVWFVQKARTQSVKEAS